MEIQRVLPIIMNFTQQSVEIKCFGSNACDRISYKYVSAIRIGLIGSGSELKIQLWHDEHFVLGNQDGMQLFSWISQIL